MIYPVTNGFSWAYGCDSILSWVQWDVNAKLCGQPGGFIDGFKWDYVEYDVGKTW